MQKNNLNKPEPKVPADFYKALKASSSADVVWKSLTLLARWDFIIWINQTRNLETRRHRIEVAISKLTAGKRRPCCFTIVPAELYRALKTNPKAKLGWNALGPIERRNFITWIDTAKGLKEDKIRIQKVCNLISLGKKGFK